MCGLFGIVFQYEVKPTVREMKTAIKVFETMAVFSAGRGTDSTGIAIIGKDGGYSTYKGVAPSYQMVSDREWGETMEDADVATHMLMGHTRFATTGDITLANVHPFVVTEKQPPDLLIGAHNGVISNHKKFGTSKCDSHNIMQSLSKTPTNKWKDILDKLEGSFALTIYRDDGTIALARNSDSPLMVMDVLELGKATVYASEEHIIRSSLATVGILSRSAEIREVPEDYLITQKGNDKPRYTKLRDSTWPMGNHTYQGSVWDNYIEGKSPSSVDTESTVAEESEITKLPLASDHVWLDSENELQMTCVICEEFKASRYITVIAEEYVCDTCAQLPLTAKPNRSKKMQVMRKSTC